MAQFAILCDCTSDLTEPIRERFAIDYLTGHIVLPDKSAHPCSLSWDLMSRDEFYTSLTKKDA